MKMKQFNKSATKKNAKNCFSFIGFEIKILCKINVIMSEPKNINLKNSCPIPVKNNNIITIVSLKKCLNLCKSSLLFSFSVKIHFDVT